MAIAAFSIGDTLWIFVYCMAQPYIRYSASYHQYSRGSVEQRQLMSSCRAQCVATAAPPRRSNRADAAAGRKFLFNLPFWYKISSHFLTHGFSVQVSELSIRTPKHNLPPRGCLWILQTWQCVAQIRNFAH